MSKPLRVVVAASVEAATSAWGVRWVAPRALARVGRWLARLGRWQQNASQRWQLRKLASDPDFLKDIGRSRAEALHEAEKPFWVP